MRTVSQRMASGLAVLVASLVCAVPAMAAPHPGGGSATLRPAAAAAPGDPASPAPKPAHARVWLSIRYGFWLHGHIVTIPHRGLNIRGDVWPYVPGQWVTVKALLHGHVIKTSLLRLTRSADGTYGHFTETVSSPGAGRVVVRVTHATSSTLAAFTASRHYLVLDEGISFGATGWLVQLVQRRLAALHFYIPQTGVYDTGTGWAIDAYHRLLHWGTSQTLDHATLMWLLSGWGAFQVRFPSHGPHAEGNLSLQLLALIDGSHVRAIYPISSGKPSTPTVLGDFHVYMKDPGYLPDGMFDSNFFFEGYAIHGYDPAPDYPASHGCMRVPIPDAPSIFNWLGTGDWVDVYY